MLTTKIMTVDAGVLRSIECFRYILEYSGKYVFSCNFLGKIAKSKKKILPLKRDYELIYTRPKFAKIQYLKKKGGGELLIEIKGGNFVPKSGKR